MPNADRARRTSRRLEVMSVTEAVAGAHVSGEGASASCRNRSRRMLPLADRLRQLRICKTGGKPTGHALLPTTPPWTGRV